MSADREKTLAAVFPEVGAGGFTRVDGSIEFYSRVQALLAPEMRVLDFGAGRGQWFDDDTCAYRKTVRQIRGKVRELVACDVDSAVLENRAADRVVHTQPGHALPFEDASFELIVADYVFEHLSNPLASSGELGRVLSPGGWLCARTPNAWGYVALVSRLVGNRSHVTVLHRAQPRRKAIDVFPTVYKLNSLRAIRRYFRDTEFENFSYRYDAEPAYFFDSPMILRCFELLQWILPPPCASQLFVFLRKRGTHDNKVNA